MICLARRVDIAAIHKMHMTAAKRRRFKMIGREGVRLRI